MQGNRCVSRCRPPTRHTRWCTVPHMSGNPSMSTSPMATLREPSAGTGTVMTWMVHPGGVAPSFSNHATWPNAHTPTQGSDTPHHTMPVAPLLLPGTVSISNHRLADRQSTSMLRCTVALLSSNMGWRSSTKHRLRCSGVSTASLVCEGSVQGCESQCGLLFTPYCQGSSRIQRPCGHPYSAARRDDKGGG